MASSTNQYIRQILHHSEAPPPVKARFFYTSPLAIDDPLSPLPPSAQTAQTTYAKLPPRPFSEFDNTALDKAWHDLRHKLLRYSEERGEKQKDPQPSGRQEKGKKTEIPSIIPSARRPASTSDASTRSNRLADIYEAPAIPPEAEAHDTTGTPFIRAPSARKVDRLQPRPKPQPLDSYQWDDPSDAPKQPTKPRP
ncbi:hypothetical protein KCU63_g9596, partial [Aureobasidium melanogenum]